MKTALCILLMLVTKIAFGQSSTRCDAILQGLYNFEKIDSEKDVTRSFRNWFRSKNFKSFNEAESFGVSATIPIKDILVGIGVKDDKQRFSEFLNELEKEQEFFEKYKVKLHSELKTVNPIVVNAWSECQKTEGTNIWLIQGADEHAFTIYMNYASINPNNNDSLTAFEFSDEGNVLIAKNGPFVKKSFEVNNFKLTRGTRFQHFKRKDICKPLTVNITTLGSKGINFDLKGNCPEPPPKEYEITFTAKDSYCSIYLSEGWGHFSRFSKSEPTGWKLSRNLIQMTGGIGEPKTVTCIVTTVHDRVEIRYESDQPKGGTLVVTTKVGEDNLSAKESGGDYVWLIPKKDRPKL